MVERGLDNAFAHWLEMQRRTKSLSRREVARRSGVSHSTVARIEHGAASPRIETAIKIARGLRDIAISQSTITPLLVMGEQAWDVIDGLAIDSEETRMEIFGRAVSDALFISEESSKGAIFSLQRPDGPSQKIIFQSGKKPTSGNEKSNN